MDESIILAEKLKKHDEEAFDRIIEIYTPMVWAIVKNISGSSLTREDTEETVSDVFVTLWKNAGNFDPERLKGYIASIAKSKTRNRLASIKKVAISDIDDIDLEDDFSISSELEKNELKKRLAEAVSKLSEEDREILIRHYFYYQKTAEIAQIMNMNHETVRVRLYRIKDKLKKQFQKEGLRYEDLRIV